MKTKYKILSALLAFVLAFSSFSSSAYAYPTGNDYPSRYKSLRMDARADVWSFYVRECTSFVAHCLNTRNGVSFNNWYRGQRWGNANHWMSTARRLGYRVDKNPKIGSIACYNGGRHGHVAWVRAVHGSYVTVDEYNWARRGGYGCRTVSKYSFSGFIHLRDIEFYPLNVNMSLDGVEKNKGLKGVTFDVRINGRRRASDVQDYKASIEKGYSYAVDDIKVRGCYKLKGTSSFTGRIRESKTICLSFVTDHSYNKGVVTKAPTCLDAGVKTYTCLDCGSVKKKEIPALDHAMEKVFVADACDGKPYYIQRCTRCTEGSGQDMTDSLKYSAWTQTRPDVDQCLIESCVKSRFRKLTTVDVEESEDSDQDGVSRWSDWSSWRMGTMEATDKKQVESKTFYRYIKVKADRIQKKGHVYSGKEISKKASSTCQGSHVKSCFICSDKESGKIPLAVFDHLAFTEAVYDGQLQMPACILVNAEGKKLTQGKDFKVSYKNNRNVGTAEVKIRLQGQYRGSISESFRIIPARARIRSLDKEADSMMVNMKGLADSLGGRRYKIEYRQEGSLEWKSGGTTSQNHKLISGLNKKKNYEVRVRAYVKLEGKKYRGDWSKVAVSGL